mmetsp:Transcript_16853/g.47078  ORF Transcript_16853/g.47078 Transcript_16853/m.47078 type:complete len:402 (-) Transcript_16853:193-1398(-)
MEGGEPPAKKRGSDRQITQDDPPSDEDEEPKGTWSTAPKEVLAQRRVVQVKRKPRDAAPAGANPFAGVSLFGAKPGSTGAVTEKPAEEKPAEEPKEEGKAGEAAPKEEEAKGGEAKEAAGKEEAAGAGKADSGAKPSAPLFGSFNSSGSQNPFASAAAASGTASGFSSFAAAAAKPAVTPAPDTAAAADGGKGEAKEPASSSFTFANPSSGAGEGSIFPPVSTVFGSSTPLFGGSTAPAPIGLSGANKPAPVLSEEKQVTGEEEEAVGFSAEAALFEFDEAKTWKERGRGEIRLNLAGSGQARFVMRQSGNYRLLLNANLWPGINVAVMDGARGVTFAIVNCAQPPGEDGGDAKPAEPKLSTYAVRFKTKDMVPAFREAVDRYKCKGEPAAEEEAGTKEEV